MRGSAVIHAENNHEGTVANSSEVISLLPVSHQTATEPKNTFSNTASLVPRTQNTEDTNQDSLTYRYLRQQYIRASRHKSTVTARALRNLACRRSRHTDLIDQKHVSCGSQQQHATLDFVTVQSLEPTVMVERLEVEVHRNGRIVPASNGIYHILNTSEPDNSSCISSRSFCVDDQVMHIDCPLAHISATGNVDGVTDPVTTAYESASYDDAVKGGYERTTAPLLAEKTPSRRYSTNDCLNKSTYGSYEIDHDINTGNNSDSGPNIVSTDRQAIQKNTRAYWRPVYEDISDTGSDVGSIKETEFPDMGKNGLDSTQRLNPDCDRPRYFANRRRYSDSTDVTDMAGAVNGRRYSSPEDTESSGRKRNEKDKKETGKHRRWSFNTESDVYQTQHGDTKKKMYLNRLLFSKDATIKSWNICIDLSRDEHTAEEFQFPELLLPKNEVKEEKEVTTSVTEGESSDTADSVLESSPVNGQTKSWKILGSEIKQEMNIEDEDTIEGPGVFVVPKKRTYNSRNVTEESSVTVPEIMTPVPKSPHNNWMVSFTSGVPNESGEQVSDTLEVIETADHSSSDAVAAVRAGRNEDVPYDLTKIMNKRDCSTYAHHQIIDLASKQIERFRGFPADIENDVCRNIGSNVRRHEASPECPSVKNLEDTPKNNKKSGLTTEPLLPNIKEVICECCTCAQNAEPVILNDFDCNSNSEQRGRLLHKEECRKPQNCQETHPSTALMQVSSQGDVTTEQIVSQRSFANTSNTRLHNINVPVKEHPICKSVHGTTDPTEKHSACAQMENIHATEDVRDCSESHELRSGNRCSSLPKIAKIRKKARFIIADKLQHESNKAPVGNSSRKRRYSRRSFRHDSIQMFKASAVFPPHNTLVPWRYKCKKPDSIDTLNTDSNKLPSPVSNSSVTESRFDESVTNIEIEDDIPSPASLTIDLGEQNTNGSESSNDEEGRRGNSNSDAIGADGDIVSCDVIRRGMSCETDSFATDGKVSPVASPENQSVGGIDSEASEEGQSKKRRKGVKKRKSDDASVTVDVKRNVLTAQMQEKGRRLAQELPGFNWLEEKIRNGGMTTLLSPKRLSGPPYSRNNDGSIVDNSNGGMKEISTSEVMKNIPSHHVSKSASDAARSDWFSPLSPPEYRHSKRLQEYLSRPPKKAKRVSTAESSELGNQRQEVLPPLPPPAHEHVETSTLLPTSAPVTSLQRLTFPQQKSPEAVQPPSTVIDGECSPHLQHQTSRRPVIVSASEVAKNSDVSPLIQQLTSGGELEVTLTTPPTSSSASSDSGVGSSSHRTSSDADQPEVMHVSIKAIQSAATSPRKGQQYTEEKPSDCTSHRRASHCVEQQSRPLQTESNSVHPRETAGTYICNREPAQWHADLPARRIEESTSGQSQSLPYDNADKAYSDRIATMARHAATSFDTGFGMGLASSHEPCHPILRHPQHRSSDLAQQPMNYHRENMLKTSGYIPPLAHQSGTYDSRLSQQGLFEPSYVFQQHPIKPQVVRPSAQYPVGVGPCHPAPAYLQTVTAVSSGQDLFPRIAQYSNSFITSQTSMFSPRREMNSNILSTNIPVPSPLSSPVQGTARKLPQVPPRTHNETLISCPRNETQVSGPENQRDALDPENEAESCDYQENVHGSNRENRMKISDPVTKEKNPPKDIEEIRKAAEAATEELEKLEQLKITTKMNLQRLKLAEEQAIEELARKQKQTEETIGVHKAVEPNPATPSSTAAGTRNSIPELHGTIPPFAHKGHEVSVGQDDHQSGKKLSDDASDNGCSTQELQTTFPSSRQENQQSSVAGPKHKSGATSNNHHSEELYENHKLGVPQKNFHSQVTCLNKQPTAAHENCQSKVAYRNPQSGDVSQNQQSGASNKNQQSSDSCENCQTGTDYKNQSTSGTRENQQLEVKCNNENTAFAHHEPEFARRTHLIEENSSISLEGTGNVITESKEIFPAVVQMNRECDITRKDKQSGTVCEPHETQERMNITSESAGSSTLGSSVAPSTAEQKSGELGDTYEGRQSHPIPDSSKSAESSMPELHTSLPVVVKEENLAQQTLNVPSNSIGKSVPGFIETFPAVTHKNHESYVGCRARKIQEQDITSDCIANSVQGWNITLPEAVLRNQQSELEHNNQQSETEPRNHKTLVITADIAGSSVSGMNVTFPAVVSTNKQLRVERKNEHYQSAVPSETHQFAQRSSAIVDTTRNSIPGSHMTYPKVSYQKQHSEQRLNATVSMTKNSVPVLLTTNSTVGQQNQEAIQRPLSPLPPPSPLVAHSPLSVSVSLAQRPSPVQTSAVSHQIAHSQSQAVPYLQHHSLVMHLHPTSIAQSPQQLQHLTALPQLHPKLLSAPVPQRSCMPRPTLYPQPFPQSQSLPLSKISPRFQLPNSQASQYSQSLIKCQTLPVPQIFPHSQNSQPFPLPQISSCSQSLSVSRAQPHAHPLPLSQTSPHSRSLPLPRASAYSQFTPVCPHSQPSQISQVSQHSQPESASQSLHQQPLKVPLHPSSLTQPFQLSLNHLRSTENMPQSSVMQSEVMPPSLRRQRILPKPPQLVGSYIPASVHPTTKCTSHQTAPAPITVRSRQPDSYKSVIPQGSELQEPLGISQEPCVAVSLSSNSLRLPSSTVEEHPIDLSISKRKSLSEDKNKPPTVKFTAVQQYMNDENNVTGQSCTSPRNRQRSRDQPSEVGNPTPEECSVKNQSGLLHQGRKISQAHMSRHVSTESSRHGEQIRASEAGNKRKIPSHVTSVSAANLTTGTYRLEMKPSICPLSVPGSSDRKKHFETADDQNIDGDSVVRRQQVNVSTHHGTLHHSHHQVCSAHQYHTHGPMQCNSYIPVYHETVLQGLQKEQRQRTCIEGLHSASSVASDRGKYWSANKQQLSPTAPFTSDQSSQDSHTVEGDQCQPHLRLVCGRCNQTARFMCSACHNQWYCSSDCQLRHWSYHSLDCRRQVVNENK